MSLRVPTMKSWGYCLSPTGSEGVLNCSTRLEPKRHALRKSVARLFFRGENELISEIGESQVRRTNSIDESAGSFAIDCPPCCSADVSRHGERLILNQRARTFAELWENLVPEQGPATSVQAEILRAVGRLAGEDRRDGCVNWDKYYEDLVEFLPHLAAG